MELAEAQYYSRREKIDYMYRLLLNGDPGTLSGQPMLDVVVYLNDKYRNLQTEVDEISNKMMTRQEIIEEINTQIDIRRDELSGSLPPSISQEQISMITNIVLNNVDTFVRQKISEMIMNHNISVHLTYDEYGHY
jgi:hypothetical protein